MTLLGCASPDGLRAGASPLTTFRQALGFLDASGRGTERPARRPARKDSALGDREIARPDRRVRDDAGEVEFVDQPLAVGCRDLGRSEEQARRAGTPPASRPLGAWVSGTERGPRRPLASPMQRGSRSGGVATGAPGPYRCDPGVTPDASDVV